MANPSVQTWQCQQCGKACERTPVRGQKPRWCSQRCADLGKKGRASTCQHCSTPYVGLGATYCSVQCSNSARRKPPRPPKPAPVRPDLRSPLRRAYESEEWATVLGELMKRTERDPDGCLVWAGRIKGGYPLVSVAGRWLAAHRLAVEASIGARLGSQPVHHKCANTRCVNPDHLSPVTHRENVAEMLSRRAYMERIAELEGELARLDPSNRLLSVIPFY